MPYKIITNGKSRPIEHLVPANEEDDIESYFTYRGHRYFLNEFTRTESNGELEKAGWNGICGESYFSAVIIKLSDNSEGVIVGYYVSTS